MRSFGNFPIFWDIDTFLCKAYGRGSARIKLALGTWSKVIHRNHSWKDGKGDIVFLLRLVDLEEVALLLVDC